MFGQAYYSDDSETYNMNSVRGVTIPESAEEDDVHSDTRPVFHSNGSDGKHRAELRDVTNSPILDISKPPSSSFNPPGFRCDGVHKK